MVQFWALIEAVPILRSLAVMLINSYHEYQLTKRREEREAQEKKESEILAQLEKAKSDEDRKKLISDLNRNRLGLD